MNQISGRLFPPGESLNRISGTKFPPGESLNRISGKVSPTVVWFVRIWGIIYPTGVWLPPNQEMIYPTGVWPKPNFRLIILSAICHPSDCCDGENPSNVLADGSSDRWQLVFVSLFIIFLLLDNHKFICQIHCFISFLYNFVAENGSNHHIKFANYLR